MTNITLSINNEVYQKMKKFSEIKWSEFVRKCIQQRIEELEKIKETPNYNKILFLADEELLAKDWLSEEDNEAWKNL